MLFDRTDLRNTKADAIVLDAGINRNSIAGEFSHQIESVSKDGQARA
jgi:hypothetical protein